MVAPTYVARTGWTTQELTRGISQAGISDTFSLVSLLIGVNNQFRGYPVQEYESGFRALLLQAIGFAGGEKSRVIVLSIPDYGVTPQGMTLDEARIAAEIDAYNAYARATCELEGILFFDITPISREAAQDPELIAPDRLHPSGKMYARWVDLIVPAVRAILD
jgi:lysophospholipase L1-like esterase